MAGRAAVLGVYLMSAEQQVVRVGALTRDNDRATTFIPDQAWLQGGGRPILTLGWYAPDDPGQTRARIADRNGKIGLYGRLPPWFQGLLPEGALRDLLETEMGAGHDHFDVLVRLGADLPGAVLVIPDNAEAPDDAGAIRWERVAGFRAPLPRGVVKFSLAGVQLKFVAQASGERLTAPARSGDGRLILKLASERYPGLPEAEYTAMTLAAAIGVRTAPCRLAPVDAIEGIPAEFLHGPTALVVERFDRPEAGGRVHIEDAAQILGLSSEEKYGANTETVLNLVRRFSTDWRDDIQEAFRRIVADVLLGNGDNHLKNWSFIFPAPGVVRLSPAYDIVPTVLFNPRDDLALPFAGRSKAFEAVTLDRFRRAATFLNLPLRQVEDEVARAVQAALDQWPDLLPRMPIGEAHRTQLLARLETLPLVQEATGLAGR